MDYDKLRQISKVQQAGLGRELLKFVPVLGTGLMAYDAYQNAKQGNWGSAAIDAVGAGLGLIPGLGGFLGKGLQTVGKGVTKVVGSALKPVATVGKTAGKALLKTPMMKDVPGAVVNIKNLAKAKALKGVDAASGAVNKIGTRMNAIPLNPKAQTLVQKVNNVIPKNKTDFSNYIDNLRNIVRTNAIPLTQLGIHVVTDPNMEVQQYPGYYETQYGYTQDPYMFNYSGIVEEEPYIDPEVMQAYYAQQMS